MKSYRNLYPQIVTWYNLHEAWRKARKGKRGKVPAANSCLVGAGRPADDTR